MRIHLIILTARILTLVIEIIVVYWLGVEVYYGLTLLRLSLLRTCLCCFGRQLVANWPVVQIKYTIWVLWSGS